MFLRAFRRNDKRHLQQLFFEVVHNIEHPALPADDLDRWAPLVPNREIWSQLAEQHCFVVEQNKSIVGFGSLNPAGDLEWLYVHPNHQGKGIAKALVRQLEKQVKKQGRPTLTVLATINAVGFFKSIGYVIAEENPLQGAYPLERIWLKKSLEQENQ